MSLAQRFPAQAADFASRAATILTPLIDTRPEPAAVIALAEAREVAGQSDLARDVLVRAIDTSPSDVELLCTLAALHLRRGETPLALARAEAAANASPDSIRALATLVESAVAAARAAEPSDAGAAKRHREAANRAFERLRAVPSPDPSARFLMAGLADQLDRHADALAEYQVVLDQSLPASGIDPAIVRNNMAYLLFRSGAQGEALRKARTLALDAVAARPNLGPLLDTLGAIEAALGDAPAAITTLRRATAADPNAVDPFISLADLLAAEASTRDEARELLSRVDAAIAAGAKPSPTRTAALQRARAAVSK
jgi:tetratricopeptide (TPR) repeat protein